MPTVLLKRQGLDPEHVAEIQRAVEMGEEVTAAGRLPSEVLAESLRIHGKQENIAPPRIMFCQSSRHLSPCREMDEAVEEIVGRAFKTSPAPRLQIL